jgi:hypothetical protein
VETQQHVRRHGLGWCLLQLQSSYLLLLAFEYLANELIHLSLGKMSIPYLALPLQVQRQVFALAEAFELVVVIIPIRIVTRQPLSRKIEFMHPVMTWIAGKQRRDDEARLPTLISSIVR